MGYGIAQAGRMAGTWPEQRLQLKHMLLMDWGWKPWYGNRMLEPGRSANLHGLYTVHSKPGFGLIKSSAMSTPAGTKKEISLADAHEPSARSSPVK